MSSRPKDKPMLSTPQAKKRPQPSVRLNLATKGSHQAPPSSSTDSITNLRQKYDEELSNLISSSERQQKDSAAEIKQLQTQVAAAQQERDAQSIRANALADQTSQIKRKLKTVKAEKSQAENRCASALSKAAAANEQIEDLTSDLEAVREDLADSKKDVLRQQNHELAMREVYAKVQAELLAVSSRVREASAAQEKHIDWMESRTMLKSVDDNQQESGPSKRFKIISSPTTQEQPASSSAVHSSPSTSGRDGSMNSTPSWSVLSDAKAEVLHTLRRFDQTHTSIREIAGTSQSVLDTLKNTKNVSMIKTLRSNSLLQLKEMEDFGQVLAESSHTHLSHIERLFEPDSPISGTPKHSGVKRKR